MSKFKKPTETEGEVLKQMGKISTDMFSKLWLVVKNLSSASIDFIKLFLKTINLVLVWCSHEGVMPTRKNKNKIYNPKKKKTEFDYEEIKFERY